MTGIQETKQIFKLIKIFEDTIDEVASQTDDDEVCTEIRQRVVNRMLNEIKENINEKP